MNTSVPLPIVLLLNGLVCTTTALLISKYANTSKRTPTNDADDAQAIQDVLAFWFGDSNDPRALLRRSSTLWFVKEGPERDAVDERVTVRFKNHVDRARSGELDKWYDSRDGALALVLLLDQLARHVYRGQESIVQTCCEAALKWSNKAVARGDASMHEGSRLSFLLMPRRHQKPLNVQSLESLLSLVDDAEVKAIEEKQVLSRFKRASEASLAGVVNSYRYTPDAEVNLPQVAPRVYTEADVLEPDEAKPLPASDGARAVETLVAFYARRPQRSTVFLVSLSGGVDSMVVLDILHNLYKDSKTHRVVAAHVDYGNRPESKAESDFLEAWCGARGVRLSVRHVAAQGLLRGITNRDEYEKKSREIRFDLYKEVWEEMGAEGKPIALFGHHQGDIVENVLSNALKGRTLLELSGMTDSSEIHGCVVERPFLSIPKSCIFDYAHTKGVPYFKDTTPRWSTRGQTRNEVLPCLERVYGVSFHAFLADLAAQSDALDASFKEALLPTKVFPDRARHLPAFVFDLRAMRNLADFQWRIAFRRACVSQGIPQFTDKAVGNVRARFGNPAKMQQPARVSWIRARRDVICFVYDSTFLCVLRDLSVDSNPSHEVELRLNEPAAVGLWRVCVEEFAPHPAEVNVFGDDAMWRALVDSQAFEYLVLGPQDSALASFKVKISDEKDGDLASSIAEAKLPALSGNKRRKNRVATLDAELRRHARLPLVSSATPAGKVYKVSCFLLETKSV